MKILVMGVSGSGKSSFGKALAEKLGLAFFDADDFHRPELVAKMASGKPLNDEERLPWLRELASLLSKHDALVLACSALKQSYRSLLRQSAPELKICYLQGSFEKILERLEQRGGHFFAGPEMLQSQFDNLEEPQKNENPLIISVEQSPATQLHLVCELLQQ